MIHSHQVPAPVRDSTSVQSSMLIARQRIGAECQLDLPSIHGQNIQVHTVIFGKKACGFLVS